MPIACDPNQTYEIVLASDENKPPEVRPTFVYRHLSAREWKQVARLQDALEQSAEGAEAIDKMIDAARLGLVDWRNMTGVDGEAIPFDVGELDALLGPQEAAEMIQRIMRQRPTVAELKKSPSQSPSSTDSSAKDAPEADLPTDAPAEPTEPAGS